MITIYIDGEVVHEIDERAYRKRIMHVDLRDSAKSVKQEHIDLPIIRDVNVHLVFDPRADTDLAMLEEEARLEEADKVGDELNPEPEEEAEEVPADSEPDAVADDSDPVDESEPAADEPTDDVSTDDGGPLNLG